MLAEEISADLHDGVAAVSPVQVRKEGGGKSMPWSVYCVACVWLVPLDRSRRLLLFCLDIDINSRAFSRGIYSISRGGFSAVLCSITEWGMVVYMVLPARLEISVQNEMPVVQTENV